MSVDENDIPITESDRLSFLDACASAITDDRMIRWVLGAIGFEARRIPSIGASTPELVWYSVFEELRSGAVRAPYRRLLDTVSSRWPNNPEFTRLRRRYPASTAPEVDEAPSPAPESSAVPRQPPRRRPPGLVVALSLLAVVVVAAAVAVPLAMTAGSRNGRPPSTLASSSMPVVPTVTNSSQSASGIQSPAPGDGCRPAAEGTVTMPPFFPPDGADSAEVRITGVRYVLATNASTLIADMAVAVDGTIPSGYHLHLFSREDKKSRGGGPGADGYVPGDDVYKPAAAIRTDSAGCWREGIRLGDAEEAGLAFDLFVVLLDEQAFTRYVESPPAGERLFTKDSFSEGNVLWLTQIEVPT